MENIENGSMDASLTIDAIDQRLGVGNKNKKRWKRIGRIVIDILLGALLALFALSIINRVVSTGVFPYTTMVVATGSMAEKYEGNTYLIENELDDQIQVNDLIVVKSVDSLDEIELYDIVCYINSDGEQILHRVVEIHDGYLVTRGDANSASDSTHVTMNNLIGVYTHFRIPYVGIIVFFVQSNYGIVCFIALFYFLFLYDHVKGKIKDAEEERKELLLSLVSERLTFTLYAQDGIVESINGSYRYVEEERTERATYLLDNENNRHDLVAESN